MPNTTINRPTLNMARTLGVAAQQVANLADYSERRARELMDEGYSLNAAINMAADETVEIARSLGMLEAATS